MGYQTIFRGQFQLEQEADPEVQRLLRGLSKTARFARDVDQKYGVEGEFYFEMWEDEGIPLIGLKFKFFPPRIGPYIRTCTHVIAPFFILLHYNVHYGSCFVIGIAIGNIQWE